jgi:hypothetical protein
MLDQLMADWVTDTGKLYSDATIHDLMVWSHARIMRLGREIVGARFGPLL